MRFFVDDSDGPPAFLTGPDKIDEQGGKALDFIIAEAGKFGIRLTINLLNLWKPANGVPSFEKWCGTEGSQARPRPDLEPPGLNVTPDQRLQQPYDWLMLPKCRDQVKQYFSMLVGRVNTVTGVAYRDDPTIMSWNLLNEPRCKYCGTEAIDSWYGDMAAHLKSVDPNHMVTTGQEGFFAEGDPLERFNPGGKSDGNPSLWGPRSGQDFRANHAHAAIDYAVIHMWPDNWREPNYDINWARDWITSHAQARAWTAAGGGASAAAEIGKPLVLEEFGKEASEGQITSVRDPWYQMVHGLVEDSLATGGSLRAALFWQWDGTWSPMGNRPETSNHVHVDDTTFTAHIKPFAKSMAEGPRAAVPGCTPRTGPAEPVVQSFEGDKPAAKAGRKLLA
ncbi:Mannan endo-1,4-beta-mannosidase 1 [Micractinium conductrix]|uniref:mannan endo-1,4-beta-mannosidase n=1 Tax=Micractinium conductrix TaxID=554055 RepID=A0A2P6V161_9CHLO|nr:Mannan endo-1,4-beta-mannosidase 1 [Micractinium conductrix]|eukprot:PSC67829.1 Mannan endo-1,4-beta-mannosidase 1 [Micractinium conductrix]